MSDYILGTHNSWSYVKPLKWYMKPFHFVAKCQSKNIEKQYTEYGVRLFDLRVKWYNGTWYVAHGSILFNMNVYDALEDLKALHENNSDKCYLRIILEYNSNETVSGDIIVKFIQFCEYVKENYNDVFILFGGLLKSTWKTIYDFGTDEITLDGKYSSTTSLFNISEDSKFYSFLKRIDDWWPWLYAKLKNKENYENGTDKDCLHMDFINIGYEYKQ